MSKWELRMSAEQKQKLEAANQQTREKQLQQRLADPYDLGIEEVVRTDEVEFVADPQYRRIGS